MVIWSGQLVSREGGPGWGSSGHTSDICKDVLSGTAEEGIAEDDRVLARLSRVDHLRHGGGRSEGRTVATLTEKRGYGGENACGKVMADSKGQLGSQYVRQGRRTVKGSMAFGWHNRYKTQQGSPIPSMFGVIHSRVQRRERNKWWQVPAAVRLLRPWCHG